MFPLVRDLVDDGVPDAVTCRVLGFSKQVFFTWRRQPVTDRDWSDAHLVNAAIDIHHDDPEFGYRFITGKLAEAGIVAGRNRVNRLCTSQRLWSVHSRKRGLNRRPGATGSRRPCRATVHRCSTRRALADRHHRAPDRWNPGR